MEIPGSICLILLCSFVFFYFWYIFDCQTEFFGRHGDFEVCIYENRGSGFSSTPKRNYRMQDMAEDALELTQQLGWDRFHCVGVSMGGMIAQQLALKKKHVLSSLFLASTHAGLALPPLKQIPSLVNIFTQVALGLADVKNCVPGLLYSEKWLTNPAPIGSGCRTNLEYMMEFHSGRIQSRPPQVFGAAMAQLWGICRHYMSPHHLEQLRSIPSMVVHGSEDCLVHAKEAYRLAKHMGSRLVLFDSVGHAMNHEHIDTFNHILLKHMLNAINPLETVSANASSADEETRQRIRSILGVEFDKHDGIQLIKAN